MKQKYQNLAVIVVDMQERLVPLLERYRLVNSHKKLIKFAKRKNLPLVFLEYSNDPTIFELKKVASKHKEKEYLSKFHVNGFKGKILLESGEQKTLDTFLKEKNIEKLIISGIYKTACVKETAKGAKENGYEVLTSKDLMDEPEGMNEFYQKNTQYFDKTSRLIKYLKK